MQSLQAKAFDQITSIKKNIEQFRLSSDSIIKKDYNYEFNVFDSNSKIKVLLYFGKKGLKLVYQGDLNSSLYKSIVNLSNDQQTLDLGTNQIDEPDNYIGTDEVGKGDLFGPLVVAAVRVNDKTKTPLSKAGVRDSKDLSDYQIGIIAKKIREICKNDIAIVTLLPEHYNVLYDQYKNLNKLLSFCHSEAIKRLLDTTDAGVVISDKFGNRGLEIHSNDSYSHIEFLETEKAERFIAVAAASIIARDEFVNWFIDMETDGFNFPKGSSEKTKVFLEQFIKSKGKSELNIFAKLHFKTIKER